MNDLNPMQNAAVRTINGPLLIIAGPGSGKTKTLVERVVHLIVDEKIEANSVLIATFTEKAAKELITRVSNRAMELGVDINLAEMYIGTLHSIFLRVIEEYRPKTSLLRNYRLMDEFEQKYLLHRNLRDFQAIEGYGALIAPQTKRWDQAEELAELVNKAAEEDLDIDRLEGSRSPILAALGRIARLYHAKLAELNALDFSTIQSTMWRLLMDNPDVLERLRERFRYLMVDEYQDTNAIQEKILLALAAPRNNICVVGDDDQSLYRFRGATVRNILEFEKNFEGGTCQRIELVTNYRSHPGIIEFYNAWMGSMPAKGSWVGDAGERYRYDKRIVAQEADFADYRSVVKVIGHETQDSWNEEVLAFISALRQRGLLSDNNQIAFLFKSVRGDKATELASFLESRGVPVFSPRSQLFFQREEIRLVIGAFAFMFPGLVDTHLKWNAEAHLDVWDYYRSCLDAFVAELRRVPELHGALRLWCAQKGKAHARLTENTNYAYADLFYGVLAFPMFSRFVDVELDTGVRDLRPVYNLALFSQLLTRFEFLHNVIVIKPDSIGQDLRSLFNYYLRFLIDGGIAEYEDFDTYAPSGCVSFMTIHQSKGLEFPVVLVDSLNSVPRKAQEVIDGALREHYYERPPFEPAEQIKFFDFWRLYYTAFSRAQNILALTGAEDLQGRGLARLPSTYFRGVYDGLPDWHDAGIQADTVKLASIKGANIKHEYSFTSHILLYENCPLQYKFFRELEFSPARTNAVLFGTLVHQTIEDAHKTVLEGHPERVTHDQIAVWLQANYASLSKATRTYLAPAVLSAVEGHVLRYVDHASRDWSAIQEAEVPVTLLKSEYVLKGTIDLIRGAGGSVEILDFKTEKKPYVNDGEGRAKLERYRRQLEVYAHIIEERYGKRVSRMHLYYTGAENESPYVSYDFERKRIDRTIEAIDGVVGKIEAKDFDHRHIKKTEQLCRSCDVKPFCWRADDL